MKDRAGCLLFLADTQPLEPGAWHLVCASYDDDTGIARCNVDDKNCRAKNLKANAGVATTDQFKLYVGGVPEAPAECSCYNGGSCAPRDDGYMCILSCRIHWRTLW
ncbi:hypothetical protein OS493_009251 [Desmophyllum pertusum]|uniref:Uncharacterized protein n=1 Tax=Desmophyllum pertusum TaxID=174260 RepID=A0A9W9Z2R2_9CNID|nr:hypothetical protein OS493_009251 [Desmophyllum pertusum]